MKNGMSPYNHREVEREWQDRGCCWPPLPGGTAYADCPRDLLLDYGYEAVRLYELFTGRPVSEWSWEDGGLDGVYRFLARLWLFGLRLEIGAGPACGSGPGGTGLPSGSGLEGTGAEGMILSQEMKKQVSVLWERGDGHGMVAALMSWFKKLKALTAGGPVQRRFQEPMETLLALLEPAAPAFCYMLKKRRGAFL